MPTFMLMTKLSPEVTAKMNDRAYLGRAWLEEVKAKFPGVKFISHYGLLGPFDFCDIYEAPDSETAAKVSMISLKNGAEKAESWIAIPYKKVIEIVSEI